VVRVPLERRATAISSLVVIGVRADIRWSFADKAAASTESWLAVIDDLPPRLPASVSASNVDRGPA
jgi:hypothetical protein